MPARNRVTPLGEIEAIRLRGVWTGNRGIHELPWAYLPDGAFVLLDETPAVIVGNRLSEWTNEGYRERRARPARGTARAITPPSTIAALRAGYPVQIDDGARM